MEKFSLNKRLKSFTYACKGIGCLIRNEHNAWIHCVAVVAVVTTGLLFGISRGEWIAVVLCCGMVLAAEAMNTAIEVLVDLVSPQPHPLAGKAKDIAAGAVLITAVTAAIVGCIVFLPYIIGFTMHRDASLFTMY